LDNLDRELEDIELKTLISSALDRGIVLAGRTFVRAKTLTFEHFNHRVNAVKSSGVMPILRQYKKESDDSDILAAALIAQASTAGQLFVLMGALLVEKDVPWTVENAASNAAFFAGLTDVEVFQKIEQVVLWLLLDFFHNGVASNVTILKYLFSGQESRQSRRNRGATPILENLPPLSRPSPSADAVLP
jgi:hypothetical protein